MMFFKYKIFMCRNKICHHHELILHNRTLQGYSSECSTVQSITKHITTFDKIKYY